jgi:predicted ATPase
MVYVITGGPGFGKTTVVNLLAEKGFTVCPETARDLLISNKDSTNDILKFPVDFERKVAMERMNFLLSVDQNVVAFADRGLPDQIAYSYFKKKSPSAFIEEVVLNNRYAPYIFVAPPWKEIFIQDEIRKENFEEASEIHRQIINTYLKYNYKIIDLPFVNPDLRVKFILDFLDI